jgi:hypothetical protein
MNTFTFEELALQEVLNTFKRDKDLSALKSDPTMLSSMATVESKIRKAHDLNGNRE